MRLAMLCLAALLSSAAPPVPAPPVPATIARAVARTEAGVLMLVFTKVDEGGREYHGHASACVIDARGYAVTCHHVVAGTTRIVATRGDGTRAAVTVSKRFPKQDLAFLSFQPGTARPLVLADGLPPRGTLVVAVGNPLGYAGTITIGVIGCARRDVTMGDGVVLAGLIQHSAALNPGSSGGALLNLDGELLGVEVAVRSGSQGIAFAVPARVIRRLAAKHLPPKESP